LVEADPAAMAEGFGDGRRIRRWPKDSAMAEEFGDGRRIRRWPKNSAMAEEFGPRYFRLCYVFLKLVFDTIGKWKHNH
jgi:hypothetical protein